MTRSLDGLLSELLGAAPADRTMRSIDGIPILRPQDLTDAITRHPAVLSPAEVRDLAARIDAAMPRA